MSAILFISFIELQGQITAVDFGNWIMLMALGTTIIRMKMSRKKEQQSELNDKANKVDVKDEIAEVHVELDKKVDKDVFAAHCADNEKQHKDIIYVRGKVDDIYKHLLKDKK